MAPRLHLGIWYRFPLIVYLPPSYSISRTKLSWTKPFSCIHQISLQVFHLQLLVSVKIYPAFYQHFILIQKRVAISQMFYICSSLPPKSSDGWGKGILGWIFWILYAEESLKNIWFTRRAKDNGIEDSHTSQLVCQFPINPALLNCLQSHQTFYFHPCLFIYFIY